MLVVAPELSQRVAAASSSIFEFILLFQLSFIIIVRECCVYSPNWEKCAEVDGDVTTGRVPDLIEGNQYEFRVRAVNKAGPGEASDPTKPHIARPKNCE